MSIVAVSKQAGVSIATVSRVMHNNPSVAPELAEAVRRVALEVGYKPSPRRKRRTNVGVKVKQRSITLLFPDPSASALKTMLSGRLSFGINQALGPTGSNFMISSLVDWGQLPPSITQRSVDGVIVRGTVPVESLLSEIRPLPCVTVFETFRQPTLGDQVLDDSSFIGEIASMYLAERHCKHLAVILHDPLHPAYTARADAFVRSARFAGFQAALIGAAVPHSELVEQFLALSPRPDGLFISGDDNDFAGIHGALLRRGICVGDNFKMIGTAYDAVRMAALDPTLDHIDIEPEAIGREAVATLMWRFENPDAPPIRKLVAPRLVLAKTAK